MSYIAGLLTCVLLLNALLLILLVLVQLPKKDAGAGLAFGGGAADALFGAGSGNALTKITKWGTAVFIALALGLGYLQDNLHRNDVGTTDFFKNVGQKQLQSAPMTAPSTAQPAPAPSAPHNALSSIQITGTNVPAAPATTPTK